VKSGRVTSSGQTSAPLAARKPPGRPCVVVQNDLFNHSRIRTVVVCAITSNLRRAQAPGNVLLEPDEGGLPYTIGKEDLAEKTGSLSNKRIHQILEGIRLLTEPV
jgi:mRNA interferase MazF